jgi:PPOX class probable F420-dependent enzyme
MPDEQKLAELLAGPCPAVLTTYRADGSVLTSPVWVGVGDGAFEIVMAADDGKVRNLRRDPRCLLVIFETSPPFRGIEVRGTAEIEQVQRIAETRRSIAVRYLGVEAGNRFASARADLPSVLVRVRTAHARTWDLSAIITD